MRMRSNNSLQHGWRPVWLEKHGNETTVVIPAIYEAY